MRHQQHLTPLGQRYGDYAVPAVRPHFTPPEQRYKGYAVPAVRPHFTPSEQRYKDYAVPAVRPHFTPPEQRYKDYAVPAVRPHIRTFSCRGSSFYFLALFGTLLLAQIVAGVCFFMPQWKVLQIGRYTLQLGVWSYCLSIQSYQECGSFQYASQPALQSVPLRVLQVVLWVCMMAGLVCTVLLMTGRRWQMDLSEGNTKLFMLDCTLLIVVSVELGCVVLFGLMFVALSTTSDVIVNPQLDLQRERHAGWALIVSIVAHSILLIAATTHLLNRRELSISHKVISEMTYGHPDRATTNSWDGTTINRQTRPGAVQPLVSGEKKRGPAPDTGKQPKDPTDVIHHNAAGSYQNESRPEIRQRATGDAQRSNKPCGGAGESSQDGGNDANLNAANNGRPPPGQPTLNVRGNDGVYAKADLESNGHYPHADGNHEITTGTRVKHETQANSLQVNDETDTKFNDECEIQAKRKTIAKTTKALHTGPNHVSYAACSGRHGNKCIVGTTNGNSVDAGGNVCTSEDHVTFENTPRAADDIGIAAKLAGIGRTSTAC